MVSKISSIYWVLLIYRINRKCKFGKHNIAERINEEYRCCNYFINSVYQLCVFEAPIFEIVLSKIIFNIQGGW